MLVGKLYATLGMDMSEFEKSINSAQAKMKNVSSKMKDVGKSLSMYVTAPMIGLGVASFKMGKDFEASMAKITGLVGIAKNEVDAWKSSILDLSIALGRTPKELADAMFFITSAGLKGQEALEALEMSAKASASGLGETKVIADLVTSAMNAYGAENLSAANATDILVAAVREGKAEADSLAGSMGRVLPIASEMGVSFDQVGAAIAAMTRTGTSADEAATSLRGILASLTKPTKDAEKALKEMGLSSAGLRKTMKEDGLIFMLGQLREATNKYGDEAMGRVIPNIRALMGVLDLMGANAEDNIALFERMTDTTGSLETALASASETADMRWNKVLSQGQVALIKLSDSVKRIFLPILETLGSVIERIGGWYSGLSDTMKTTVTIIAGIVTAIGPLLIGLGTMISLVSFSITGLVAMKLAFIKLTAVMLANPFVAVATAIGVLGGAFLILRKRANEYEIAQNKINKGFATAQLDIVRQQEGLDGLISRFEKTNEGTRERAILIEALNNRYGEYLPNLVTEKTTISELKDMQKLANNEIERKIMLQAKEQQQQNLLQPLYNKQATSISKLREQLSKTELTQSEITARINQFVKSLRTGTPMTKAWFEAFQDTQYATMTSKFRNNMTQLAESIEYSNKVAKDIDLAFDPLAESFKNTGKEIKTTDSIINTTANTLENLKNKITELQTKISDAKTAQVTVGTPLPINFNEWEKSLKEATTQYESIQEYMTNLTEQQEKSRTDIIVNENEKRLENMRAFVENIRQNLKTKEQLEIENAKKTTDTIRQAVAMNLITWQEGNDLITAMNKKMLDDYNNGLSDNTDNTTEKVSELSQVWENAFNNINDLIGYTITDVFMRLGSAIGGVKDAFKDFATSVLQNIQNILAGLVKELFILSVTKGVIQGGLIGATAALIGISAILANVNSQSEANTPQLQGLYTGGEVVKSGAFMIGEQGAEMVTLPKGAAVTPNHALNNNINDNRELVAVVSGEDLRFILKKANDKYNRR